MLVQLNFCPRPGIQFSDRVFVQLPCMQEAMGLVCRTVKKKTRGKKRKEKAINNNFFLQGINIHLAKKMIEDRSRDYMNARRVAKV